MRALLLIPLLLSLLYLNTAIIHGIGGPGEKLVIKPLHGVHPFYGGGGENSWIRNHPGEELPWWHYPRQDYLATLIKTSYETTVPPWTVIYGLGYCLWLLSLASTVAYGIFRANKTPRPNKTAIDKSDPAGS